MLPTREEAMDLLRDGLACNPESWGKHCLTAAHCAEKIAAACGDMDPEKAYILGLLHDIGRKFGVRHLGHVSDGYTYMKSLGYDEAAKVCLTHSFHNHTVDDYIGKFDVSEQELALIQTELDKTVYDEYDRLIQLCDALAGAEGVLDIEERMSDVRKRYGSYPPEKWAANIRLMRHFEEKMHRNVYLACEKDTFRPEEIGANAEERNGALMEEKTGIVAAATQKMIEFYKSSLHDIDHFLKVWAMAKTIGELEGLGRHTQEVLELAAVVHDISCPLCREKYGNADGKNQERESPPLVEAFFRELPVDRRDVERISWLVAHHHTYTDIDGIDHRILLEADFLVNAGEGGYARPAIDSFRERVFRTAAGTKLLDSMYRRDAGNA